MHAPPLILETTYLCCFKILNDVRICMNVSVALCCHISVSLPGTQDGAWVTSRSITNNTRSCLVGPLLERLRKRINAINLGSIMLYGEWLAVWLGVVHIKLRYVGASFHILVWLGWCVSLAAKQRLVSIQNWEIFVLQQRTPLSCCKDTIKSAQTQTVGRFRHECLAQFRLVRYPQCMPHPLSLATNTLQSTSAFK